jgi:hypothetical protein
MWAPITFDVGSDYAMWAPITVKQQMLPTSHRNRCPHQTETGAHIEWNHLPTSTGIRSHPEQQVTNKYRYFFDLARSEQIGVTLEKGENRTLRK